MMALSLALVVGLFSTFAYADGSLDGEDLYGDTMNNHSRPWGEDIVEYQENNLKKAVERNRIAEKQAKMEKDNYNYGFNRKNNYSHGHCRNRSILNS